MQVLRKHGLTLDRFERMSAEQNGVCAICFHPDPGDRELSVDHDHTCCPGVASCGKCIRGLLCGPCNRALGQLRESPEVVMSAYSYLVAHAPFGGLVDAHDS